MSLEPWGTEAKDREIFSLSGALVAKLPMTLSAARSRERLSSILSVDVHQLHFVRKKDLTDRAFVTCEACTVIVAPTFQVRCAHCQGRLRCSCFRQHCLCVRSKHYTSETCDACSTPLSVWFPPADVGREFSSEKRL